MSKYIVRILATITATHELEAGSQEEAYHASGDRGVGIRHRIGGRVMSSAGWIGSNNALMNYLSVVRADRDDDGRFLIYGKPITSFMGMGEEMVVPGETEYSVDGRKCNLAAGLNSTSARMPVVVFS